MARAPKKQTVADAYVGRAALTIVRRKDRTQAYVYAGAPVPGDVDDAELLRLAGEGFIAPTAAPAKSRSTPRTSTLSNPASSTPVNDSNNSSGSQGDDDE